jgi:hypothetical protein
MGVCWYCHWGWAKKVTEIYEKAVMTDDNAYMALHFGPSHIVWEDENFDDYSIRFCLKQIEDKNYKDIEESIIQVVQESLQALLKIPEKERCIEPVDYDDENPENYPPTCEVKKPENSFLY